MAQGLQKAGILPINEGGTEASNIIKARKNLGYLGMFLAPAVFQEECIVLSKNINLNTVQYTATGKYVAPVNDVSVTISNCPTTFAFQMMVYNLLDDKAGQMSSAWTYRFRILINYYGDIWTQYISSSDGSTISYGSWRKIAYES